MSDSQTCVLFALEDGIARIVLNRPDQLNAITVGMHQRLAEILDEIEACADLRVVLLTGAGRGFCAGQDLGERPVEQEGPLDLGESIEQRYNPLIRRLARLPVPLVCAVNGVAAGAGAALALMGDMVIAAQSASFILSFARIGLMPDCGMSWLLPRLIGQPRALGMAMTGERITAARAQEWGMIWQCAPDEDFIEHVDALVSSLAAAPTQGIMAARDAIRQSWARDFDAQLDIERDGQRRLGHTQDYREGVSAFRQKRRPQFRGC
ncbi:2-(1,2-epoxy-1,2-dihydrophenyl)acetyl-CoA isomerase PaaG [Novosphingobium sp. SG707]|uniref:2-(1,2-epoxy-1,2-dihydrophenyl)acetyl-CoA isomerase PaaG n=1 Tax=Novosphingobium sp. SG707 TaxID=2586996 RepID=UPI0014477290|nr:2-(1,2-epoxy-1,2-dihydrophenyl)acetyl-CoA isomerase PaaG [Novosphingobium sp. SG707]NKJ02617.1 2-(1,2-epoxy-1,2-dihydrophenyl)acetyl-CoA isomerase [Novosphingobium sp. SG707]